MSEELSRRERKKLETRQSLLAAAMALFHEKGYDATPIEDITERADVAKGTFFNYFPSKEALLAELALWRVEKMRSAVDVRAGAPASPVARLKRLLALMQAEVTQDGHLMQRAFAARLTQPLAHRAGHHILGLVYELVAEAQAAGEIRGDVEPELVGDLVHLLFFHQVIVCHHAAPETREIREIGSMIDLLIDGLAGPNWRRG
ncbi:MAG TPA: helix-turn-helix domain-containing protein [Anaerolineae bacterium]|nr:helix-turn-helix domain-containing protein [Anaerolineae bacterium]